MWGEGEAGNLGTGRPCNLSTRMETARPFVIRGAKIFLLSVPIDRLRLQSFSLCDSFCAEIREGETTSETK